MYDAAFSTEILCNTGIFTTQDIFRTLSNIYYEQFLFRTVCNPTMFRTLSYLESKA